MDINLIKRLIRIVEKSEITDFSVQEGDLKLRISKNNSFAQPMSNVVFTQQGSAQQASSPSTQEAAKEQKEAKPVESAGDQNIHEVRSPIVGTFYRAPAPDADPYIQIGDQVTQGSVLCIVEAMKLMNEIECDVAGKIIKILVDNATPVEYNQPLFLIQKD